MPPPTAPAVVANLTAPLLRAVAGAAPIAAAEPGLLRAARAAEVDQVVTALGAAGLEIAERRVDGDWAALLGRSVSSDGRAG